MLPDYRPLFLESIQERLVDDSAAEPHVIVPSLLIFLSILGGMTYLSCWLNGTLSALFWTYKSVSEPSEPSPPSSIDTWIDTSGVWTLMWCEHFTHIVTKRSASLRLRVVICVPNNRAE